MHKRFPTEFVYQVFALLLAVIVVHAAYVAVIRPKAQAYMEQQAALVEQDKNYEPQRSLYVLIRDYEQEICFILMFWAFAIIVFKAIIAGREHQMLSRDILGIPQGTRVLPEDTTGLALHIEKLAYSSQQLLLPRALTAGLHRFGATHNVQDVSTATHSVCESESERLDSELSMIRYIAWAIPSIGFIGTVRGIGDALGQAHKAVEGDITGVTQSLGVAFNSTLIALVISIVLMFVVHQLQLMQERLVLDTETYCDRHLLRFLYVP